MTEMKRGGIEVVSWVRSNRVIGTQGMPKVSPCVRR